MDENNVVTEEVVDTDVVDTEYVEDSGRDYLKDGIAVGVGLLAIDGAVHVGKFVYTKGIKPAFNKAKTWIENKKTEKAQKKLIQEQNSAPVENSTEQ